MAERFRHDQSISDIMARDLSTVESGSTISEAARLMRDRDTGAIIVTDGDQMSGLLTDRDIAVRAVAEGRDPESTSAGEIASRDVISIEPSSSISDAIKAMREANIRRVPVVEGGRPVGVVSLGDLAIALDEQSALADISSSSQNN
jgi:CBS domain-containing protein